MSATLISSLPKDLLLLLANSFLFDREACAIATTSQLVHRLLQSEYRIKSELPLSYLLSQRYKDAVSRWIVGRPQSVLTTRDDCIGLPRLNELSASAMASSASASCLVRTIRLTAPYTPPYDDYGGGEYDDYNDFPEEDDEGENDELLGRIAVHIVFPSSLTELLGVNFSGPLSSVQLPPQLRRLQFADDQHPKVVRPVRQSLAGVVFPQSLTALENVYTDSVDDLKQWKLPATLRVLTFHRGFNLPLQSLGLPEGLTQLSLSEQFNQSLIGLALPSSLEILRFGGNETENSMFAHSLAPLALDRLMNLTDLSFFMHGPPSEFASLLMPPRLRRLVLPGSGFTLSALPQLPETMELLTNIWPEPLTARGNNNAPSTLPPKLRLLYQPLTPVIPQHTIPDGLLALQTHMIGWTQGLASFKHLPSHLTDLSIGMELDSIINQIEWPQNLRTVTFQNDWSESPIKMQPLPDSVTQLTFTGKVDHSLAELRFPHSLTSFNLSYHCYTLPIEGWNLPPSCTELSLIVQNKNDVTDFTRVTFPPSIQSLTLDFNSKHHPHLRHLRLPPRLTQLNLLGFNQSLSGLQWPAENNDTELTLRLDRFDRDLQSSELPPNCTDIDFGFLWNGSMKFLKDWAGLNRLRTMRFGRYSHSSIKEFLFPSSLLTLDISQGFQVPLQSLHLPSSLREIVMDKLPDELKPKCQQVEIVQRKVNAEAAASPSSSLHASLPPSVHSIITVGQHSYPIYH